MVKVKARANQRSAKPQMARKPSTNRVLFEQRKASTEARRLSVGITTDAVSQAVGAIQNMFVQEEMKRQKAAAWVKAEEEGRVKKEVGNETKGEVEEGGSDGGSHDEKVLRMEKVKTRVDKRSAKPKMAREPSHNRVVFEQRKARQTEARRLSIGFAADAVSKALEEMFAKEQREKAEAAAWVKAEAEERVKRVEAEAAAKARTEEEERVKRKEAAEAAAKARAEEEEGVRREEAEAAAKARAEEARRVKLEKEEREKAEAVAKAKAEEEERAAAKAKAVAEAARAEQKARDAKAVAEAAKAKAALDAAQVEKEKEETETSAIAATTSTPAKTDRPSSAGSYASSDAKSRRSRPSSAPSARESHPFEQILDPFFQNFGQDLKKGEDAK